MKFKFWKVDAHRLLRSVKETRYFRQTLSEGTVDAGAVTNLLAIFPVIRNDQH